MWDRTKKLWVVCNTVKLQYFLCPPKYMNKNTVSVGYKLFSELM